MTALRALTLYIYRAAKTKYILTEVYATMLLLSMKRKLCAPHKPVFCIKVCFHNLTKKLKALCVQEPGNEAKKN